MENEILITYKWEEGIYSLDDMLILVEYKKITPQQFFEITRFNYDAIKEQKNKGDTVN